MLPQFLSTSGMLFADVLAMIDGATVRRIYHDTAPLDKPIGPVNM